MNKQPPKPVEPPLGEQTGSTVMTVAVKGALGAIPILGGVLAEAAGQLIPQQRIERIEAFLRYLNDRLDQADQASLRDKLQDAERLDLFEEGAFQSTRALSEERKHYIANVVANGIDGDEKDKIEAKRILRLLRDLDDEQIVILTSYLHRIRQDVSFRQKHQDILNPPIATLGSGRDVLDKAALADVARAELRRLGLLRPTYRTVKRGELPEFDDKTGMMKVNFTQITPLGRLLLRHIGLAEADDF